MFRMRVGGYLSPCYNCSTLSGQVRRIGNSPFYFHSTILLQYFGRWRIFLLRSPWSFAAAMNGTMQGLLWVMSALQGYNISSPISHSLFSGISQISSEPTDRDFLRIFFSSSPVIKEHRTGLKNPIKAF